MNQCKLPMFLNLAACHIKMQNWTDARINCEKALDIDENNVKVFESLTIIFPYFFTSSNYARQSFEEDRRIKGPEIMIKQGQILKVLLKRTQRASI